MKLDKITNFTVTRSFSQKIQLKQFEPVDYFASYTAIVKSGATEEELKEISDEIAEKAEMDVYEKINPSNSVARRVTLSELKTTNAQLVKKVAELEAKLNSIAPF